MATSNVAGYYTLAAAGVPLADNARRVAYRFRPHLDPETISDLRLALIP
ncbi:MAG: hypothetical protein ACHBMF_10765 [Chromatiales bacterium]